MGTHALIIPADAEIRHVFAILTLFPSERIHILATPKLREEAQLIQAALTEHNGPVRTWILHGDMSEDFFATASQIIAEEQSTRILASGACQSTLVAAAFTHGVPAASIIEGRVRELPVLPFDYASQLSEQKLAILSAVRDKPMPLQDVIRTTHLKPNAISYHLHGTSTKPGLLSMHVLMTDEKKRLSLTPKGKSLVRGLRR